MPSVETRDALEVATMRRVTLRLLPFLMLCYFISFLDRVNAGFAALQMNKAIGLSHAAFGVGGGLFYVSYVVFEIPSTPGAGEGRSAPLDCPHHDYLGSRVSAEGVHS